MKKLFTLMFLIATMCPLFAEPVALDMEINIKEAITPRLRAQIQSSKGVEVLKHRYVSEPFVTRESSYYPAGEEITEEEHKTDNYKQLVIKVPSGYMLNRIKGQDGVRNGIAVFDGNIRFLEKDYDKVTVYVRKKGEKVWEEISFNLDYNIHLYGYAKAQEKQLLNDMVDNAIMKEDSGVTTKDLKFTLNYSPDYFTYDEDTSNEGYIKETVELNGVKVEVKTYAVLVASKGKRNTYILLKPNFEKLYEDFECVRNLFATHL